MAEVKTERIPEANRLAGALYQAKTAGVITDALVNANATLTLLKAAILAAVPSPNQPMAIRLNKSLDRGKSLSYYPETHGVTTVAALAALASASTVRQSFID